MNDRAPVHHDTTSKIHIGPSEIHGLGGFASQPFPKESRVLEYLGKRITKAESLELCQRGNNCIFYLNEQFDLDGNVAWNPARFLNHSCAPNCEAEWQGGRIWIVAKRDIHAGEEVTFDYGYDLEAYRQYPCHCGAPNCRGYIVGEVWRG